MLVQARFPVLGYLLSAVALLTPLLVGIASIFVQFSTAPVFRYGEHCPSVVAVWLLLSHTSRLVISTGILISIISSCINVLFNKTTQSVGTFGVKQRDRSKQQPLTPATKPMAR